MIELFLSASLTFPGDIYPNLHEREYLEAVNSALKSFDNTFILASDRILP